MNLGRRGLLKLIGATPAAAALAPAVAASSAGYGVIGLAGSQLGGVNPMPTSIGPSEGMKFFSFTKWLSDHGEKELRQECRHVQMLDPDIACMHLPLNTKVQFQRERNYQRALEYRKTWFERELGRHGHVTIW